MCDHNCEHHHGDNKNIIIRVIISIIFFILGFYYRPLFVLAYLFAGFDVLFKAVKNIIKGQVFDENFLMGIATLGAFCIKEYPEAVMVMILYQIGEYFQHKAVEKSKHSISKLMDIRPDYANLEGEKVSPEIVKIGDIITVKTGEKIPLDGVIVEGEALVDTSSLTGESIPVALKKGNSALSGCINTNGVLKIRVTKEYRESTVSKILNLIENAASKKAKTENFITKFAKYYTPIVVVLAVIIAFVPPLFFGGNWINRALTFLVISCPCALVISIPLGFFAGIGAASRAGILIKGSSFIETLSKVGTVVFDKTGTLTQGCFKVREVVSNNSDILKYAAYAESASSHPIAQAIRNAYGKEIPIQNNIKEIAGFGVEAIIDNKKVLVGNYKLIGVDAVDKDGSITYVSIDGNFEGYISASDALKDDAQDTIEKLKKNNISTIILTGDTFKNAQIGYKLGVDRVYSELLPQDKVKVIEEIIESEKNSVVFVGDGINDAPVLTRADVGVAMGALGSDAAIEAADVVIMDDKPSKIVDAIRISKKTMRIVKQNIVFALGIKFLFLIFGSLGMVTMWGAVFADVGVSLIAIVNSLRALKV